LKRANFIGVFVRFCLDALKTQAEDKPANKGRVTQAQRRGEPGTAPAAATGAGGETHFNPF
jgi:hypothetical protein